jgi:hypothetical protein
MLIRAGALAALLLSGSAAMAQECPLPDGANSKLVGVDAATRLAYLRATLNQEGQEARNWKWRWVGGYSVIAVGQLAFGSFVSTTDQRPGLYIGGVASAIAMVPLLVLPLEVGVEAPLFDAKAKKLASAGTTDLASTCELIKEGEALMVRAAANEARGAGWITHVINIIYNGIVAVIIGAPKWPTGTSTPATHNWSSAAISGGVGVLLGEGMALSQPNNLGDAWKTYKSGDVGSNAPKVSFGPAPGSYVALSGKF